jgi:hypothetical protein
MPEMFTGVLKQLHTAIYLVRFVSSLEEVISQPKKLLMFGIDFGISDLAPVFRTP